MAKNKEWRQSAVAMTGMPGRIRTARVAGLESCRRFLAAGGHGRTLATTSAGYNPMSYHNGSVWPHDNALCAAGLMRYGFIREAQQVAVGILEAAEWFGGRLPELFCGFDRAEFPEPVAGPGQRPRSANCHLVSADRFRRPARRRRLVISGVGTWWNRHPLPYEI